MSEAMTEVRTDAPAIATLEDQAKAGGAPAGGDATGGKAGDAVPFWQSDAFQLSADRPDKDTISDAEWMANKKFGSPADMVASYRALEARFGSDKVPVPKGADDKEGWDTLFKALGRPDDPKGYDVPVPDGMDSDFADQFRAKAHDLGLLPHQVKGLAEWNNALFETMALPDAKATEAALRKEWKGDDWSRNVELARRAAATLGLDEPAIERLTVDLKGAPVTLKLLARMGGLLGEHGTMPGGNDAKSGAGGFGSQMTPEQAKQRKAEIMANPELRAKLNKGDPALKAEWQTIAAVQAAEYERQYGQPR